MLKITIHEELEASTIEELKSQCWSGALGTLNTIEELGLEEEFLDYLTCVFDSQVVTLTQVNDFIWFDCDEWIEEELENREEGEA